MNDLVRNWLIVGILILALVGLVAGVLVAAGCLRARRADVAALTVNRRGAAIPCPFPDRL
jgi:hypothetical protein